MALLCACVCKRIKPTEIARCFCSICKKLNETLLGVPHTDFVKYKRTPLLEAIYRHDEDHGDHDGVIVIKYKESDNIWIACNLFKFDYSDVDTYDLFIDAFHNQASKQLDTPKH